MSDSTPPPDREAKRRPAVILHVEEVTGNVALTCRYKRPKLCPHARIDGSK